jgi:hypothetical protein
MIGPHAEPPEKGQLHGHVALLHHQHYSSGPIALGEAASARSNGPCRYQVEPATAPLASCRVWAELKLCARCSVDRMTSIAVA